MKDSTNAGKIGYTAKIGSTKELSLLYEVGKCEEVVQLRDSQNEFRQFEKFLKENKAKQIVLVSFSSMGLQLSQVTQLLEMIYKEQISLHFIEKKLDSDEQYLALLYELSINEKEVVSRRTRRSLRVAHKKGVVGGRPTITKKTIERIQYIHLSQKKTIREISNECGVSLGTVHKYINQIEQR